jgi:hypothetical protein
MELLLETIEKIEKRDRDVLPLFYERNTFSLSDCRGYELISDGKALLSEEIKRFIKTFFTEKKIKIEYFKSLLAFIKHQKPLSVFSTNYDVCVEEFCKVVGKEYVDGFNPKWNPEEVFGNPNSDVRLYKLHGSVTWYRSEEGDYESSRIMITDMKVKLATGQELVPFIVYPGRKLEYNEPTIDLLVELRRQLKSIKYLFVVGYSFKDNHIAKIFKYAAKANPNLVLVLISPAAHEIYYFILKRHTDEEFRHGFMHENFSESFDTDLPSGLEKRVIRLPYKFEKIVHLLKDKYLDNLKKGEECEELREEDLETTTDKQIAESRWHECLIPYIECEYIDKVEEIIEKKI